ncbi:MAG: sulfur carrier protein ThiS [Desulfovibrionaceae bacterium]|nr:sulfur carrier protein ThiS [Desulfovibrionaceae bacterium]
MEQRNSLCVTVNGQERQVVAGMTVEALLHEMQVDPGRVVVERNLVILPSAEFARVPLLDGDSIEVIHFVGGG